MRALVPSSTYGRGMLYDLVDPGERPDETAIRPAMRSAARWMLRWLLCVVVAAVISTPWALERAVEQASFDDRLGTLPVQVGLAHNGYTTLDTGVFGKVYWRRTGPLGFGAQLRSTGPPVAGGTLASYTSPAFVRANTSFVDDPDALARVYGAELRRQVVDESVRAVVLGGVLAGTVLAVGWYLSGGRRRRTRAAVAGGVLVLGVVGSVAVAASEFASWDGNQPIEETYPLSDRGDFAFSSPQSREIAIQVQPFIEKNTARIRERTAQYEAAAIASLDQQLTLHAATLAPHEGEVMVIAEADPQGSLVGTRVRRGLYAALRERLPDGALVVRTIAGDITSNGTVAESAFVSDEAAASPEVPVVAAKGDHDTDVTVEQLVAAGVLVPDTEVVDAGGLRVASARDPAFKALFGGLVVNESGTTEEESGAALRDVVDEEREPTYVVVHQPRAVDGYLGFDLDEVRSGGTSMTVPVDDGLPDIPAGIVTYGHLHDPAGPWVVWNTDDAAEVTWTVVTQLGTAGGVEETPTFNRFSTPFSAPLKALSVQLQYLNPETGLQTGLVSISIATDGTATIEDRVDVGMPGGRPGMPNSTSSR
jgi:hypothetical protein